MENKLINEIKKICSEDLRLKFLYESNSVANVKLDRETEFPLALLLFVREWNIDNSNNLMKESGEIKLFFLNRPTRIDYDGEETQSLIDQAKELAILFVREVNKSKVIKFSDSNIRLESIVDYDDANVCGVCLSAFVEELGYQCF